MTWVKNLDFTSGHILTAAELNHLADNLEETAPAKATSPGSYFVGAGPHRIAERKAARRIYNVTSEVRTNTWGDTVDDDDDPEPELIRLTGPMALVCVGAETSVDTVGAVGRVGYQISGATSKPAVNNRAIVHEAGIADYTQRQSIIQLDNRLTPGQNTFTVKYKVTSGIMTVTRRRLVVVPF